jgi:hypothetical protein
LSGKSRRASSADRVAAPTKTLPRSRDKLAVLAERARLGLPLFHPLDRPLDDRESVAQGSCGGCPTPPSRVRTPEQRQAERVRLGVLTPEARARDAARKREARRRKALGLQALARGGGLTPIECGLLRVLDGLPRVARDVITAAGWAFAGSSREALVRLVARGLAVKTPQGYRRA